MALSEDRVLKQVAALPEAGAINVQWSNRVLRDGVVISETYDRKTYGVSDKDAFLAEVEGAAAFAAAMGW